MSFQTQRYEQQRREIERVRVTNESILQRGRERYQNNMAASKRQDEYLRNESAKCTKLYTHSCSPTIYDGENLGPFGMLVAIYCGVGGALCTAHKYTRLEGVVLLGISSLCNIAFQALVILSRDSQYREKRSEGLMPYYIDSYCKGNIFSANVETGNVSRIFSLLFGAGSLYMMRWKKTLSLVSVSTLVQSGLFYLFARYCQNQYQTRELRYISKFNLD